MHKETNQTYQKLKKSCLWNTRNLNALKKYKRDKFVIKNIKWIYIKETRKCIFVPIIFIMHVVQFYFKEQRFKIVFLKCTIYAFIFVFKYLFTEVNLKFTHKYVSHKFCYFYFMIYYTCIHIYFLLSKYSFDRFCYTQLFYYNNNL